MPIIETETQLSENNETEKTRSGKGRYQYEIRPMVRAMPYGIGTVFS
jgi:hypothetical protein